MSPRPPGRSDPPVDPAVDPPTHAERGRWEALIAGMKPASAVVVIASAMSRELREHCSPEDIWQETLAQAWRDRARHRWQGEAAFRAWIFEIARNCIRQAARGLQAEKRGGGKRPTRFSEMRSGASGTVSALLPADSQTPSRIVVRGEKKAALRKALARLPPDVEPVVRLHLLEERTMEAIAERLGIGVSAAWHRYRKGAEILLRILPGWTGDPSSWTR